MYLTTDQPVVCRSSHFMPSFAVETLLEKGSSELNEDVLLEAEDLFGVFDGATSLDTRRFADGRTGGLLAAQTAARAFQQERASLSRLAEKANTTSIRKALRQQQVSMDERHRLWSTSMAVVRMGVNRLEYCQTGDALILLLYNDGSYRVVTPDLDIDRETLHLCQDCRITPSAPIHRKRGTL